MMRVFRLFFLLISFMSCFSILATLADASDQFEQSLISTYAVQATGRTLVKHEIHIKNKYSVAFSTQYALEVNAVGLQFVRATSVDGVDLQPHVTQTNANTNIAIVFSDKVVGKDKERVIYIEYEHPDIAMLTGSIVELNIPKVMQAEEYQQYQVRIAVPRTFGEVSYASPRSYAVDQEQSNLIYTYGAESKDGISMMFGDKQVYRVALRYHLQNPSMSQGIFQVALPPDTAFQKVFYEAIEPLPDKIEKDVDGNWIATFTIASQREQTISATAVIAVYLQPVVHVPEQFPGKMYLSGNQYWDVSNTEIEKIAKELRTPKRIYEYLVQNFSYDYERLQQGSVQRKGAAQAILNPTGNLCQEYTDTFIALSRASGVPAREVNGYAYTKNSRLRPLGLVADVLHAWPEYYDSTRNQWIPVDPTWGSTTSGVDYFTKLDFYHLVFVIHGESAEKPYPAGMYKISGEEEKDVDVMVLSESPALPQLRVSIEKPFLSHSYEIKVKNLTGAAWYDVPVTVVASPGIELAQKEYTLKELLPFQEQSFVVELARSPFSFSKHEGQIHITIAGETISYDASTNQNVTPILLGAAGIILAGIAGGVLVFRRRR